MRGDAEFDLKDSAGNPDEYQGGPKAKEPQNREARREEPAKELDSMTEQNDRTHSR